MKKRRQWIMDNTTFQNTEQLVSKDRSMINQLLNTIHTSSFIQSEKKYNISISHLFYKNLCIRPQACSKDFIQLISTVMENMNKMHQVINQMPHQTILRAAEYEKNKSSSSFFKKCLHYGEVGYNQKQLHILRGIGFQIGRSPLISSIESLMRFLNQKVQTADFYNEILRFGLEILRRVYTNNRMLFIYEGPKIGLGLVLFVVKKMEVLEKSNLTLQEIFGSQLAKVVQINKFQIDQIESYLQQLQKFDHSGMKTNVQAMIKKLIIFKKNEFQLPERTSPRVKPLIFQFGQE